MPPSTPCRYSLRLCHLGVCTVTCFTIRHASGFGTRHSVSASNAHFRITSGQRKPFFRVASFRVYSLPLFQHPTHWAGLGLRWVATFYTPVRLQVLACHSGGNGFSIRYTQYTCCRFSIRTLCNSDAGLQHLCRHGFRSLLQKDLDAKCPYLTLN